MVALLKGDGAAILIAFVGLMITLGMIGGIADTVWLQSNTLRVDNATFTSTGVNTSVDLQGRELVTRVSMTNASAAWEDAPSIGLVTGTSSTTGLRTVQAVFNDSSEADGYVNAITVNASYVFNPDGFLSDSSTQSVGALVLLFAVLAMLITAIVVFIQKGSLGTLMRGK